MSDLALARLAAAAYDAAPAGRVIDWRDCRMVIAGRVAAVRGTVPDNFHNWLRDFRAGGEMSADHPQVGDCPAGALEAAIALSALLPPEVDTLTGHSLGGQVAVEIAGLRAAGGAPSGVLVTWDAPKAGGDTLAALLAAWDVRQYRFRSSPVTDWPVFLDRHIRPLIPIGEPTWSVEKAHSISRAVAWLEAREAVAA